ncbi:MAG: hypothetical protein NTU89_00590 [Candidatus Dependentiae bacterium]|nr:hypothetical protein [Candidatus Dependentiae bacterium]
MKQRMGVDEKINHLEVTKINEPVEPLESLSASEKRKQTRQALVAKSKQKKEQSTKKKQLKKKEVSEAPSVVTMTDDMISSLSAQEIKNSISGSVQLGKGK